MVVYLKRQSKSRFVSTPIVMAVSKERLVSFLILSIADRAGCDFERGRKWRL